MAKYINKDALIVEIERRKQTWQHQDQQYVNGGKDICDYLLGFLDTLEVKEVDLDAEIMKYQREIYDRDTTVRDIAKHFFELGIKAT